MGEDASAADAAQDARAEHAPEEEGALSGVTADTAEADSSTFARCASCRHAAEVERSAGTLVCRKHNMLVNAEADEIPDDCVEYEAREEAGE